MKKIKWKAILGLIGMIITIWFELNWVWGALFFLWGIVNILTGELWLIEKVLKKQDRLLFWIITIVWLSSSAMMTYIEFNSRHLSSMSSIVFKTNGKNQLKTEENQSQNSMRKETQDDRKAMQEKVIGISKNIVFISEKEFESEINKMWENATSDALFLNRDEIFMVYHSYTALSLIATLGVKMKKETNHDLKNKYDEIDLPIKSYKQRQFSLKIPNEADLWKSYWDSIGTRSPGQTDYEKYLIDTTGELKEVTVYTQMN